MLGIVNVNRMMSFMLNIEPINERTKMFYLEKMQKIDKIKKCVEKERNRYKLLQINLPIVNTKEKQKEDKETNRNRNRFDCMCVPFDMI